MISFNGHNNGYLSFPEFSRYRDSIKIYLIRSSGNDAIFETVDKQRNLEEERISEFVVNHEGSPPVTDSPHKRQWRGAVTFSLICAWTNGWANDRDAGDLRCNRAYYDVTVMRCSYCWPGIVSWMKKYKFQLKFNWGLFLRYQLTICQHWFRTNDGQAYVHLNELTSTLFFKARATTAARLRWLNLLH